MRYESEQIETHVREVIAAILSGCHARWCVAIDVGANVGWMSSYMLALGAHVQAYEPQSDLLQALEETAKLNCWTTRLTAHNAFVCPSSDTWCLNARRGARDGFRSKGGVPPTAHLLEPKRVALRHALFHTYVDRRKYISLLKLDGDGPEPRWMDEISWMLINQLVEIDAITVEHMPGIRGILPSTLLRMQSAGYELYRLESDDPRRWINEYGWDYFSPNGTYARLEDKTRDSLEDEFLMIRSVRRLYRAKSNLSQDQLSAWCHPVQLKGNPIRWRVVELFFVHRRVQFVEQRTMSAAHRKILILP